MKPALQFAKGCPISLVTEAAKFVEKQLYQPRGQHRLLGAVVLEVTVETKGLMF